MDHVLLNSTCVSSTLTTSTHIRAPTPQRSANAQPSPFCCTSKHMAMIRREGRRQRREEVKCIRLRVRKYEKGQSEVQIGQFSHLLTETMASGKMTMLKGNKKGKSSWILATALANTSGDRCTHAHAQYMLSLAVLFAALPLPHSFLLLLLLLPLMNSIY